ncbi:hypothetical protein, partial [Thiolapillus sp.]|uniref:hypothetical protein n=2 Tax=Thiolapillus sp. TaxID=2017437 RepID=UPI0026014BD9
MTLSRSKKKIENRAFLFWSFAGRLAAFTALVTPAQLGSDLWLNCTMHPVPLQGIYVPEMSNIKIRLHYQYICGFR